MHENETSIFKPIKAGVFQVSVLEPLLYLLHTADIPETEHVEMAIIAADTAAMATVSSQEAAVDSLQKLLDKISNWTRQWKIMFKEKKSIQVTLALRRRIPPFQTYSNNIPVPQATSAKYLGMHLDAKLTRRCMSYVKINAVVAKLRQIY